MILIVVIGMTVFVMRDKFKNENTENPLIQIEHTLAEPANSIRSPDEEALRLGYAPGKILIEFKRSAVDLKTDEGKKFVLEFVKERSNALAPLIAEKLVSEGKLSTSETTVQKIDELRQNLITHEKDYVDENGSVLLLAIDDSVLEIVEELKKSDSVKMVTPSYVGRIGDGEKIVTGTKKAK